MIKYMNKYLIIDNKTMIEISGGLVIEIAGIIFTGWKAWAIVSAGVTTLGGAAALGVYNGYHSTK